VKILDVKQGSPEWLAARAGRFTASEFDSLMTPAWKKREGETPQNYLLRKVAERVLGYPLGDPSSWAMEQGSLLEVQAIPWLELTQDVKIDRVGFVTTDDGRLGCSPDGLIGEDGGVEIKCPQPTAHLRYLLAGGVPKDYVAQVHGSLYVTGRPWWLFVSYSRQFPTLVVRVNRDEEIMAKIDAVMTETLAEFEDKLSRVAAMREEIAGPERALGAQRQAEDEAKARAENGGELPGERWMREQGKR
jgi:hypothetical protein